MCRKLTWIPSNVIQLYLVLKLNKKVYSLFKMYTFRRHAPGLFKNLHEHSIWDYFYLLSSVCWSSWMVLRRTWNCFRLNSNCVNKRKITTDWSLNIYISQKLTYYANTLSSTLSLICERCSNSFPRASSSLKKIKQGYILLMREQNAQLIPTFLVTK